MLFAPDWRKGVPYQQLLAAALARLGVKVDFLANYKRVLPLARLLAARANTERCDVLHLHWPEAYYPPRGDWLDGLRSARFPLDLALATRRTRLVLTAHNLHAHNRGHEFFARRNMRAAFRRANGVIAHSPKAKEALVSVYNLPAEKITVIPHGDLSVHLPPPIDRASARARVGLDARPTVLMFGTLEPYKGLEEVIEFWRHAQPPARLMIIGRPNSATYGATIEKAAASAHNVTCKFGWVSDEALSVWLSAVDAVLCNYRTIFTSGAASLARSWGVPILLPTRLDTVDLLEPSARVFRFQSLAEDFRERLLQALAAGSEFASAADWREATGWDRVAAQTAEVYRQATAGTN